MKNPFPGMNPFIEGYKWPPFHVSMIVYMQEALIKQLPEGYFLEAETTLYVEGSGLDERLKFRPDISVVKEPASPYGSGGQVATLTPPTQRRKKLKTKVRSLQVFDLKTRELVTSIELLSPSNKRGEGLESYRKKRRGILETDVNLVEIDLLRSGQRADTTTTSTSPYLMQVYDAFREEILEWSVGLFDTLPTLPVPLRSDIPPLVLNLQSVFDRTYRLSSLPHSLSYTLSDLHPPVEDKVKREKLMAYLPQQTNDGKA